MSNTISLRNGTVVDLDAITDANELIAIGIELDSTGAMREVIKALAAQIALREDAIKVQSERLRQGLKETTASEYLLTLHNSGPPDKQKRVEIREAIERAMAAFEPDDARAALGTILLLAVLEGR